jgi:hypothetical protein
MVLAEPKEFLRSLVLIFYLCSPFFCTYQGFESCVLRSPREVAPHLGQVSGAAVAFMKYDPNYCDDDEDEDQDGSDEVCLGFDSEGEGDI